MKRKQTVQSKKKTARKTTRQRILLAGSIVVGLILLLGIAAMAYIKGLTDLVDQGEITGDPSFHESDLYITEEVTLEPTFTSGETIKPTSTSSETTIETTTGPTIDPRILEAQSQQLEASLIDVRKDSSVYNILLIGSDRREGETTGRADSMIILSINKRTHKIHLVSLMRGMYVKIPDHGFYMLNASYSYGGSKLLRQTIEDNLRVHIDDYIMIDFSGFSAAIDVVGGIDIDLTDKEAAELNGQLGTALTSGTNHLDGAAALAYARIRHIDSDFARTGRQRTVIDALIRKMTSLGPVELDQTARALLPLVKTNMGSDKLINLAISFLKYKDYPISQLMLPIRNTFETIIVSRMQVTKFDFVKNVEKLHAFLFDD